MKTTALLLLSAVMWAGVACGKSKSSQAADSLPVGQEAVDSITIDSSAIGRSHLDSIPEELRYSGLSDEDFRIVADELGVEVAAIKAVVLIEAGTQMKGFYAPAVPVINFDPAVYKQVAAKASNKAGATGEKVPEGISGYALKEYNQLINARKKNAEGALMGTFWGMFQIGGFNYKICGFDNVNDFVKAMAHSEFSQLEIFAHFIKNSGMLDDLKKKNWSGFARKYNGSSYARRGYHTKMANAYKKFKNQ